MLHKVLLFGTLLLALAKGASAQQLSLGDAPARLTKSAVLELSTDKQGLLLPRLTDTTAINSLNPPDGMIVFFVPTRQLMVRSDGHWTPLAVAGNLSNYWALNGNAMGGLGKLGTTDNYALPFVTNNQERMRLTATGRLGIGTTNPGSVLHVFGTNPLRLTGVQAGSTTSADSLLTINNGLVQKLPVSSFQTPLSGSGFVKASGTTISYDGNSYTVANSAITGGTKTKITFDSKGLVTGGQDATTTDIAEGNQLYFTENRVRNTALTGLSTGVSTTLAPTDNLVVGMGKLQGQINNLNNAGYLTGNQTISLSGDVSGSGTTGIASTISNNAVTYAKMQNISASNRLLGRASSGSGMVEEITLGSGLSLTGTTLSVNGASQWNTTGNSGTSWNTHFLGTTDAAGFRLRTNNQQRLVVDSVGHMGIGLANPTATLSLRDTLEIRRTGAVSALLFSETAGTGDFRIGADGGDIFWQGGGNRNLQMGAYWGIVLQGDRQTATFPAFSSGSTGINVSIPASRAGSMPLMIQGVAGQTANLTEWRNAGNAPMAVVNATGNMGLGTSAPSSLLHLFGTNPLRMVGIQNGNTSVSDSLLTISNGLVQKLPLSTFTSSNTQWSLAGNAATTWNNHFLGTTDNQSFRLRTNNTQRMYIDSLGNFGLGTAPVFTAGTNREKFLMDLGTTASSNAMVVKASVNNYLQFNLQNKSNGANASTDIVATADNGGETNNFVNLGINGSNYTGGVFGGANDAYLYNQGQDLLVGTATAGKDLHLLTGGTDKAANTRVFINSTGHVGIGTTTFDNVSPEKVVIDAGTATYTPMLIKGSYDGYFQLNIKNSGSGTQSSSDIVATANNGTETTNFINMGINGSGYVYQSGSPIETGKANDGYLLSSGADMYIVNNNATKDMIFLAGGTATTNEAMRIKANEQIGMGTITPMTGAKLDVNGAVKLGSKGNLVQNVIAFEYPLINGQTLAPNNTLDIVFPLPAGTAMTSVRGTVAISPAFDLPVGLNISFARATTTTQVKVRITNTSSSSQTINGGSKFYITVVDF